MGSSMDCVAHCSPHDYYMDGVDGGVESGFSLVVSGR